MVTVDSGRQRGVEGKEKDVPIPLGSVRFTLRPVNSELPFRAGLL